MPHTAPDDLSIHPWTDEDDLAGWEVIADSSSHGPMGFTVRVEIEPAFAPAVVRAAHAAGLDVTAFVQRSVSHLAQTLAEQEAAAS